MPLGDKKLLKISSTGDYTNKSMDEFSKSIIYGDIVKSWKKFADGRKTIVYCHSVEFSKIVANEFRQNGISAVHADSKTPDDERDRIMKDFKTGEVKVLCNVDLVSEGFNVPDCSCVVMLRPTKSLVLYLQQSMRSMRYQPNKTAVVIDQVQNYSNFGLPETPRKWNLHDRKKQKSHTSDGPPVKTCQWCFAVIPATCLMCPYCHHVFEGEKKELKNDKDAELKQINSQDFKFTTNYLSLKKPSELTTIAELKEYAKEKGYKPGWVYFQQKQRGWL